MRISDIVESPVTLGSPMAASSQTPNQPSPQQAAQLTASEQMKNKQLQRKQIQDQINMLTKQLEGLRSQLASIR